MPTTNGPATNELVSQAALVERVKELTCLYSLAQIAQQTDISLGETLQHITELLPPAWQYPETAAARIVFDGQAYSTAGFRQANHQQAAKILVNGELRGSVEVIYLQEKPLESEGPFLKEERHLIEAIARQVGLAIERKLSKEEKVKLRDQLLHADRLATIGQLAAGIAHELNEPLSSILGFAQLALKCKDLPEQAGKDIGKIVTSTLHAREVIRKLMMFARPMPIRKTRVDLNKIVQEGLFFLESRCAKVGIKLACALGAKLPRITADPSQLTQVLVNLVVNAIQAMPQGGQLTVATRVLDGYVSLVVEDTGVGMSKEMLDQIFVPFFTTKDVDEGTGLGLSVAHGIVTAHGGAIKVESAVGCGSRFDVQLPIASIQNKEL